MVLVVVNIIELPSHHYYSVCSTTEFPAADIAKSCRIQVQNKFPLRQTIALVVGSLNYRFITISVIYQTKFLPKDVAKSCRIFALKTLFVSTMWGLLLWETRLRSGSPCHHRPISKWFIRGLSSCIASKGLQTNFFPCLLSPNFFFFQHQTSEVSFWKCHTFPQMESFFRMYRSDLQYFRFPF